MNKPCYNDSLCLHKYTKMIGLKRKPHFFRVEKLKWFLAAESTFQESVNKQNFYACARAKKATSSRHSAYISSSVKSPLDILQNHNPKHHRFFSYDRHSLQFLQQISQQKLGINIHIKGPYLVLLPGDDCN